METKQLQVSAKMNIREGQLEGFKRQVAGIKTIIKEKDPGTVRYDVFLNDDGTEAEIREAYDSSESFIAHKMNIHEALEKLFAEYATNHQAVMYGNPSAQILQMAEAMKGKMDVRFYHFLQGLE